MRDDDLLRQLAAAAREEEDEERRRLDPRWDALAAGTLPAAEAEALRAAAAASPEGAATLEAFAPLGEEFRARVVEALRDELGGTATAAPVEQAPESEQAATGERGLQVPAGTEVRRRRWPEASSAGTQASRARWRLLISGSAAAAGFAAAVVLAVLRPWAAAEPLPSYSAQLSGGTEELRGEDPGAGPSATPAPPRFAPGNRFELVLTPESAVEGRPDVETYLVRDGELVPWPVPVEVSEHGAVRLAGTIGEEVRLPGGESRLVMTIGRPGSLPQPETLAPRLQEVARAGTAACRAIASDALLCVVPLVVVPEP